jgi:indolepyruvate ferredoxin oxidoreductase
VQIVRQVGAAETKVAPGSSELTEAIAKNLFKLMAYKDEYEVARLYSSGTFAEKLAETFEGDFRLTYHLAPPMFAPRDKETGRLRKKEYGGWIIHAFRMLAGLKFLRGTIFDPFGYAAERQAERKLIEDYEATILRRVPGLQAAEIPIMTRLASLPESIRGYGQIKNLAIEKAAAERARLESDLDNSATAIAAE